MGVLHALISSSKSFKKHVGHLSIYQRLQPKQMQPYFYSRKKIYKLILLNYLPDIYKDFI